MNKKTLFITIFLSLFTITMQASQKPYNFNSSPEPDPTVSVQTLSPNSLATNVLQNSQFISTRLLSQLTIDKCSNAFGKNTQQYQPPDFSKADFLPNYKKFPSKKEILTSRLNITPDDDYSDPLSLFLLCTEKTPYPITTPPISTTRQGTLRLLSPSSTQSQSSQRQFEDDSLSKTATLMFGTESLLNEQEALHQQKHAQKTLDRLEPILINAYRKQYNYFIGLAKSPLQQSKLLWKLTHFKAHYLKKYEIDKQIFITDKKTHSKLNMLNARALQLIILAKRANNKKALQEMYTELNIQDPVEYLIIALKLHLKINQEKTQLILLNGQK